MRYGEGRYGVGRGSRWQQERGYEKGPLTKRCCLSIDFGTNNGIVLKDHKQLLTRR